MIRMSVPYLKEAIAAGDHERLIRYVRLHLGDGNESAGRNEIDKAWVEALKLLVDVPPTDRDLILNTMSSASPATLAHLFFHLHSFLVRRSGEWIHYGQLSSERIPHNERRKDVHDPHDHSSHDDWMDQCKPSTGTYASVAAYESFFGSGHSGCALPRRSS